ncbi:MAG: hypothetical protein K9I74_08635 [Bacteroidales bacterium]|nr:hypothetical protein [Bacteroidales bacterium]
MTISAEVSYYPLKDEYFGPIKDFIRRLNEYTEITVRTTGMSTYLIGDYEQVMTALTQEIRKTFALPHSVFVLKLLNTDMREVE